MLVLILVLGAGTVITYGMQSIRANETRGAPPAQVVSDVPLRQPGRQPATEPAGHSFEWRGSGVGMTGTVSANGDYVLASDDGVERRYVDGTTYSTRHPMTSWTASVGDAFTSVGRLGFRSTIDVDDILTDHVIAVSTIEVNTAADGTVDFVVRIDVANPDVDPNQLSGWLDAVGMPNSQPLRTADGGVFARLVVASDGSTVESLAVDNGIHQSSYELVEVFTNPPLIAIPEAVVES